MFPRLGYWLVVKSWWTFFNVFGRLHRIGVKNVPKGPYVLVSNHVSHFDPFAIAACYPHKIDFMAMREFFKHPLSRLFFYTVDSFPVHRNKVDTEAVREAMRRLKAGRIVGIFPEGGLRSGETSIIGGADCKEGAAMIAQMTGVKVHVCLIIGGDQYYQWKNLFRKPQIYFKYGPELSLDSSLPPKQARAKLHVEIMETMRALYREFLEEVHPSEVVLPRTAQERWRRGQ